MVSASSAFMGAATLMGPLIGELQALISGDVTPWISAAAGGKAFAVASELVESLKTRVDQDAVSALATAAVHGVIDGGYTDNTGVANAVAAGADEVTVLVNSNASASLSYLFEGGPSGGVPYQPASLYPVFCSPSAVSAKAAFRTFARLKVPLASIYLTEIAVGSLTAVTASNAAWGLVAGRQIRLNVISVSSSLDIGEFENFMHYDALVQEVALAIVAKDNEQLVAETLLPMMLGP